HSIYWFYLKGSENPSLSNPMSAGERELFNVSSYDDLASGRDLSKVWMGVELELQIRPEIRDKLIKMASDIEWSLLNLEPPELKQLIIGFRLHKNTRRELDYEYHVVVDNLDFSLKCWYDEIKEIYRWALTGPLEAEGTSRLSYSLFNTLYFSSRIFEYRKEIPKSEANELKKLERFFEIILSEMKEAFEVFMLSPLRGTIPLKDSAGVAERLGTRGEGVLRALARALLYYDPRVSEELKEMIISWAERFGITKLNAGLDKEGKIRATFEDLNTYIDIAMGSHGQKQLLIMLIQLVIAPHNSIIAIEEPEISLHPNAQALLPLLFADVIKRHNKQILVTTHSSILALALSDAIMGSDEYPNIPRLSTDEVAVYHVVRDEKGYTKVEPLKLTKEGYIEGGIPSFVDVETKLYKRMLTRLS
ncbi:MAG: AAA family ATPase, partial [Desulfurococcales archaeon]|nr:AAA family ATPase [Desulfurococcales archaeon]